MAYSPSKIAIPRLPTRSKSLSDQSQSQTQRRRASRACQSCRARKAKCDEGWPVCGHCKDLRVECYYTGGKREERNRQFDLLSRKEMEYEAVLSEISLTSTDPLSRLAAQTVLGKFSSGKRSLSASTLPHNMKTSSCDPDTSWTNGCASASQPFPEPAPAPMNGITGLAMNPLMGNYIDNSFPRYSQVNGISHGPPTDTGLELNANTLSTEPGYSLASTAAPMIYPDSNLLSNDQIAARFLP